MRNACRAARGFVALFHPATWAGDQLSPFLDALPEAD